MRERFGYPDLSGRTILIIDDHPDSLTFLTEPLRFCGAVVLPAWSAAHARRLLEAERPDLIISDFHMPRESGVDFVRWLRARHDERAGIPAIALTAYPDDFLEQQDGPRAFDAYALKPLSAPDFLRTIHAMLTQPPSHGRVAI